MASFNWDELEVTFDFKPLSSTATRRGLIAWQRIGIMLAEVFPVPITQGAIQTEGVGVALPGFPWLRADSIHIEPQVPGKVSNTDISYDFSQLNAYENALVTITYITPKFSINGVEGNTQNPQNPDPVKLLEHRWSIGAEFLTIPPTTSLSWKDNSGDPISDDVLIGVRIPTIEHQVTWPYVIKPPFAAMRSCIGKTNSVALQLQTGTVAAGCLLFTGAELHRQVMSNGDAAWNVSYRFSEKNIQTAAGTVKGWNVLWNPVSNEFDSLDKGGVSNNFPYQKTAFSGLFTVENA